MEKISVIIPVYNQSDTIEKAIISVLEQEWNNIELIVVDDGSTDDLDDIIKSKKNLIYLKQSHQGVSAARNRGIEHATGEYITFLDADDTWPKNRLQHLFPFLEWYDIVVGQTFLGNNNYKWIPSFGASLFRKDVFERVGPLNEALHFSEDQEWFLRAKEKKASIIISEETSLNALQKNSTHNKSWKELSIHRVLKESLKRRGKTPLIPLSSYALVSVIVTVHNGALFLKETLNSVFAQTYPSFEVILIDHGSRDESKQIAISFPNVRYIYQEHQGNSHARNTGIQSARGEFIAFIDQDDLWEKDKLKKHMKALLENRNVLYTVSHFLSFLSEGIKQPSWLRSETLSQGKVDFSPTSLVSRKKAFEVNGLFKEGLRFASDVDWFFLAKDRNIPMKILPEVLHKRRIHDNNQSHDGHQIQKEMLRVIRTSVERKKLQIKK